MIQMVPSATGDSTTNRILDILRAINERTEEIESMARYAVTLAGQLANGIKPD